MNRTQQASRQEIMRLLLDQKNQDPQIVARLKEHSRFKGPKEDKVFKAIETVKDQTKPMVVRLLALDTIIDAFKGEL